MALKLGRRCNWNFYGNSSTKRKRDFYYATIMTKSRGLCPLTLLKFNLSGKTEEGSKLWNCYVRWVHLRQRHTHSIIIWLEHCCEMLPLKWCMIVSATSLSLSLSLSPQKNLVRRLWLRSMQTLQNTYCAISKFEYLNYCNLLDSRECQRFEKF